mmetsp:Transcript_105341/g.209356  ORF Transcript_105341/g.209356 Transcript_105341/m.209356 type:complete len:170 (+) Transcript_105341:52-561(+)|eukprot:CAMPEP_0172656246 /NCGR_PEP_ID=MMETSP1074-20121228/1237_1 /TAXON_ID=2916 /ORGANISM="Ceratium fusus, Strain PA161109" /LENGTH=169 /DNA_ID=CAMNT_0013471057 /DNA_START=36 /DNA_END=545 /DNA_ORIENTATION=+
MGLLKGLNQYLTADLLHLLRSAGHGDKIAVVDCNFPAVEVATKTTTGKLVQLAGVDDVQAIDAICSVLPLDFFVEKPVAYMVPDEGIALPELGTQVHTKVLEAIRVHTPDYGEMEAIPRTSFYDVSRTCFGVVQTMERRPYGCFIITKGVVGPDGKDFKPDTGKRRRTE